MNNTTYELELTIEREEEIINVVTQRDDDVVHLIIKMIRTLGLQDEESLDVLELLLGLDMYTSSPKEFLDRMGDTFKDALEDRGQNLICFDLHQVTV